MVLDFRTGRDHLAPLGDRPRGRGPEVVDGRKGRYIAMSSKILQLPFMILKYFIFIACSKGF